MENLKNLERLPKEAKEKISHYMGELLKIHRDNVVSIFIYGSAAGGDYIPGVSDINSVVVFKALGFDELKKSLRLIDKGIRKRIAAPLFLTPEYIKTSCDTFPIEFLEMRESHILLYGEDIIKGLEIDPSNIRFICEEQLKGKLIRMRQAYLEIGLRKRGIEALIKESLNSLFPVLRSILRLKGITPPAGKENVLKFISQNLGIETDTFVAVLRDKKNDEKIIDKNIEAFLPRYIEQVEKITEVVDKLNETTT